MDLITRRNLLDDDEFPLLTTKRRCELLGIHRSYAYYKPKERSPESLEREELVKQSLDYWHTTSPCSGVRKLRKFLRNDGHTVGRKLIRRYMDEMGIYAVYPKPRLSTPGKNHAKYPYLLRGKEIFLPNQVWAIDITYIPMARGHMYLTAIIDWYSRYIVGWALSDTLDTAPVLEAVSSAIDRYGTPSIINSDQGSQFTSHEYVGYLKGHRIKQSMDGKARWVDNVIIERWFRSLKIEYVYINEYNNPRELRSGLRRYITEYNDIRPHQSCAYETPRVVYDNKFVA